MVDLPARSFDLARPGVAPPLTIKHNLLGGGIEDTCATERNPKTARVHEINPLGRFVEQTAGFELKSERVINCDNGDNEVSVR